MVNYACTVSKRIHEIKDIFICFQGHPVINVSDNFMLATILIIGRSVLFNATEK